jgi:hypothetical protein
MKGKARFALSLLTAMMFAFTLIVPLAQADDPLPPPTEEVVTESGAGEGSVSEPEEVLPPDGSTEPPPDETQEEVTPPESEETTNTDPLTLESTTPEEATAPESEPSLLASFQSTIEEVLALVNTWVGPSDQTVEDLTDLEDENDNDLHGDDCSQNPDICEKVEGDDLPDPDENNETVVPFETIDGEVVVIHAGGGTEEIVIDLGSGDECDQSPEGDPFCAGYDEDGDVVIWSNPCAELVGRNDSCQPAPGLSYVLRVGTDDEEEECPNGDQNGDLPGCDPEEECPNGDQNGDLPGCDPEEECPNGDQNGDLPGCDPEEECPNGDQNGDLPGCDPEEECPNGDNNGDRPGCDDTPPPPTFVEQVEKLLGICTVEELILHTQEDGDLYRDFLASNYVLAQKINLTILFDYPVTNPDGFACIIVAEATRNGQKDLVLFGADGGFIRWLTDTPEDETSPTWLLNGHIVYSKGGELNEITQLGVLVANLGPGVTSVASNYTSVLAYQSADGSLILNGVDTGQDGFPVNFGLNDLYLVYVTDGVMWLLYPDGATEEVGGIDAAPDPHKSLFNGLVSLDEAPQIWGFIPAGFTVDGHQEDWWLKP